MRTARRATCALFLLLHMLCALAAGSAVVVYPGATRYVPPDAEDLHNWQKVMLPGKRVTVYLTQDSFDKVLAFYRDHGKEFTGAGVPASGKLASGQEIKKAFVILDDARQLERSTLWVSIQRPFVRALLHKEDGAPTQEVRDVTEIRVTESQPLNREDVRKQQISPR